MPRAPVVHLELHTGDLAAARSFYAELCGWAAEHVVTPHGDYDALALGGGLGGGVVESRPARALWLPYVEVDAIGPATDRARALGARVLLDSREGPAGWRSVVATPAGAGLALWQGKR